MNKLFYFFIAVIFSLQLNAATIKLEIQYEEASNGEIISEAQELTIYPSSFAGELVSDIGMYKTLFCIRLSNLFKTSLTNYHAARNHYQQIRPPLADSCVARPCPRPNPSYWELIRKEHSQSLACNINILKQKADFSFASDSDVSEALMLANMLSENMMKGEFGPVFENFGGAKRASMKMDACAMQMAAPSGLNITAGGIKDYSHFKKQIQDGFIPLPDAFIEEGFLSSFSLGLEDKTCDKLLCLHPAYAIDKEANKLFIQVGMNSNVTPETFKRPSLNLSFVIDISGSMAATDNTERTRLEWAKEAVGQAISHLNEDDIVSIVVFDSVSKVLVQPTPVSNKSLLVQKVQQIQIGGSTNLDAGLRDGFVLASKACKEGYQNRVILFSDAGLNTGVTDPTSILRLVSDYAAENIGLTAIGVGENFHHDFIHKITMSKGGNAHFVHTGADMMKFFRNFDFLVTPVAYNLKVSATLTDLHAKLSKTYGVPMLKNEPIQELINVRTLFFSEEGGAIVLEYDL